MRGSYLIHLKLVHWSLLGGLLITNVLTLAALLMNTEIVGIWKERSDTLAAYEERIAQLSLSVDRLRFRELANWGSSTSLKLQELAELQMRVEEKLSTVQALAEAAAGMGVSRFPTPGRQVARALAEESGGADPLDIVEADLQTMEQEIVAAVAILSVAANNSTDAIVAELRGIGQTLDETAAGRGGPLVPLSDILPETGELDIREAVAALDRFREARHAMDDLPIHRPVDTLSVSSDFGARKDPFTGQSAFHSGIDFPAPTGTPVRSAGRGVVTFVGWKGDYGNVVEISHGSGFVSRYPHLSKALVQEGDRIEADMQIALVGSTGRSTGPHLHFELRNQNGAIDPAPYLAAGDRLLPFDT
ncbi:Peptidase family M23 [Devosia limi DSM 17137]|uniref:Peptidase family M23 n=1 Tax=Devosia limi DSM 17137 TaxID=1121477 RepID=A0A1M5CKV7_9HYPH|nr:Peptidase family M23 [Devosia limi DSM 17137]